ncbi:MAG: hypothetical protein QE271_14220 [Bacteriovoracaceae bacterium]|nr:hypothetical protein [Bacteriovoracaceae bacterium]
MKNVKYISTLFFFFSLNLLNFGCFSIESKTIDSEAVTEEFTTEDNNSNFQGYWMSTPQTIDVTNTAKEDAYYAKYEISRSNANVFQNQLDNSRCQYLNEHKIEDLTTDAKLVLYGYFSQTKYFLIANMEYTVEATNEKISCAFALGRGPYETVGANYVYLSDINSSFTAISTQEGNFKLNFN